METKIISANKSGITLASEYLKTGQIVAFPTETVYGLGADAFNKSAVEKIFTAKDRPADNPLIAHIADKKMLLSLVREIPPVAQLLINAFWPGPLSIVFPKRHTVPTVVTGGLDTVVVRFPNHPVAQRLIRLVGNPIVAPSANRSGKVSPTLAEHVFHDLNTKIPLILDGGAIEFGIESTVVDCTTGHPEILRPGSITAEMLAHVVVLQDPTYQSKVKSPGMKYQHYAPNTPIILLTGSKDQRQQAFNKLLRCFKTEKLVLISHSLSQVNIPTVTLPAEHIPAAQKLYGALIQADSFQCDRIIVEGYLETGVGTAIMNRLRKAASQVV